MKGAETATTPEERAWFEADRRLREKLTLRDIGIWSHYVGDATQPMHVGFYKGLQELGYTEGLNISIERRYGNWSADQFRELATDLVRLKVDVIVVASTTPARAAKQATSTVPIVVAGMADPVGDELVASLSRPGGNITGTTFLGPELIPKRLGLLKDTISGLSRVAAL